MAGSRVRIETWYGVARSPPMTGCALSAPRRVVGRVVAAAVYLAATTTRCFLFDATFITPSTKLSGVIALCADTFETTLSPILRVPLFYELSKG